MSRWTAWHAMVAVLTVVAATSLAGFVVAVAAAALASERLGNVAGVLFIPTGLSLCGLWFGWCADGLPRRARQSAVRLDRQGRAELREQKQRIALDAEIARMEREAGLR